MRVPELEPLVLGRYPTPVFRLDAMSNDAVELWVKNDGPSAEPYGGNKVRKLELILAEALRRKAKRVLTAGAGGSHHVLATTLYARQVGIPVAAVLCPQPYTTHAAQTLRAALGAGMQPTVVGSMAAVPLGIARAHERGDYIVPAGGSSTLGTLGYVRAMNELVEQIRAGLLPEPDSIVAPLGSGGTVAGILAGALREGLRARVLGVTVAVGPVLAHAMVLRLARAATRADGGPAGLLRLDRSLEVDGSELGLGYGHATPAGERATEIALRAGLSLDATYTAKTFARALELAAMPPERPAGRPYRILYWHTLSSTPVEPLLLEGPEAVPEGLRALLPGAP